jgi:hypothetical protein
VVEIDRADGVPAHVVLRQDGVSLADGTVYELVFKAKSSVTRDIPIVAQVDGGPDGATFRPVRLNGHIHVAPEWQDYTLRFTPVQPVHGHTRIAFLLGGQASTFELSDIALTTASDSTEASAVLPN